MTAQPTSHAQHPLISPFHSIGGEWSALAGIVQKIACNAIELLHLTDCTVALLDDAGVDLVFLPSGQDPLKELRIAFPLLQGPLAAFAEQREALILRDVRLDARMQPLVGEAKCSLACLPLLEQERVQGWLIACDPCQDAFPPEHIRVLALLAEQVTLATSNARRAEMVRDANRMKANFLSLVTHELRSPLNTINGYLDLLLEGIAGETNEQQHEFLRRARAGSEHLYALLEDLLLASRADARQLRLHRVPASLGELVDAAIEELELTAQDGQVTLQSRLPAHLPLLLLDTVRTQQVLRNLLINALRFTPAGGSVTVSARILPASEDKGEQLLEVRVCDTGVGIAPEYHARIFERFFQIPAAEGGRTSGQGLGLAIVKLIIELHGGQVSVESMLGAGSTFVFRLAPMRQ
ncbi:MAG TPA: GAF domain-containing sensor histidine kinase [Ktedonobacteraceae bacterium]